MDKKQLKEIEILKKELEKAKKEIAENLFGWQKERAEFQNYKKNEEKRRQEIFKNAKEDFILKILKTIDLFDLSTEALAKVEKAFKHLPKENEKSIQNWTAGVEHIYRDFKRILTEEGLEEIKSTGQKFDPKLHEAVEVKEKEMEPSYAKASEGTVVEEFQKGYILNGKVLRPAKVVVGKNSKL